MSAPQLPVSEVARIRISEKGDVSRSFMGFRNVIGIMGDRNDGAKKRIITGAGKFSTEMEELVRLVLILLKHTLA